MGKQVLTFGNIEIEKYKFYCHKTIFLGDVDIEKVLVSNKISFGEKDFIGFFDESTLLVTFTMVIM